MKALKEVIDIIDELKETGLDIGINKGEKEEEEK
jgi:hypothetical protein